MDEFDDEIDRLDNEMREDEDERGKVSRSHRRVA